VLHGEISKSGEDSETFLALAIEHHPPGTLVGEEQADHKHAGGDQLDSKGDEPLLVRLRQGSLDGILYTSRSAMR
jgi:hypothetical protein